MMSVFTRYLLWLFLCTLTPLAVAAPAPALPTLPELPARGYLLVDFHSGKTLIEKNADERLEPASLTKIVTAYVVFREIAAGKIKLSDEVLISERAWRTGGSKMFIQVGTRVKIEDLLKGMMIQSGNDAAIALAEHVAGSVEAFANLMNDHAQRLGMTASHYTNPNGLPDPELYTTARDMARVTLALIREFPEYYAWYSNRDFTYNKITQQNRNPLLRRDPSTDGVKTGYTKAAGYCLIGSAKRNTMRLISVVLGTTSNKARADASLALLNYGFRFYENHLLYPAQQPILTLRAWYGNLTELPVGPLSDVAATIPQGLYDKLTARLEKTSDFVAPIAKGAAVGDVVITLGEEELVRMPVVALEEITEGNLWRQAVDTVLKQFAAHD